MCTGAPPPRITHFQIVQFQTSAILKYEKKNEITFWHPLIIGCMCVCVCVCVYIYIYIVLVSGQEDKRSWTECN